MTSRLLLHIGYHKTATSWMQMRLFTADHGYRQIASHQEAFDMVVRPHGLRFSPEPMAALIARNSKDIPPDVTPVLSSEVLSGHPFFGGQGSDVYAERLAQIVPDARVLITVRNQLRVLPSVYMQYVLRGGTMPCDRFFSGTDEIGYFGFSPDHFEYDRLVGHYQKLFGAANVCVICQESLNADVDAVAARLAAFAGNTGYKGMMPSARKPLGQSYPEHAAPFLRRLNHVQASVINPWPILSLAQTPYGPYRFAGYALKRFPLQQLLGRRRPVSDHVRQRFAGHFAASNARLAALIPGTPGLEHYDGVTEPAA